MAYNCYQNNGRNSNCNNEENDIERLVKRFLRSNQEVAKDVEKALREATQAYCSLKNAEKQQEKSIALFRAINRMIEDDNYDYCDNDNSNCQREAREVKRVLCQMLNEIREGVKALNDAVKEIKDVQCLENKLDKAFERYAECVDSEEEEEETDSECGF